MQLPAAPCSALPSIRCTTSASNPDHRNPPTLPNSHRYHNEHEAAEAFDCGALLLFGADAASNFGAPCALGNLARFLANNINMSQIEAIGRKRGREPALATAIAAAVAAADPKHVGGSERGGAAAAAKRVAYRLAPRTRAAKRAKTGAAAAPVLGSGADSDAAAAGSEATGDAAALRGGSPTPEVSDDGSSGTAAAAAAIRCTSMRASSEDGSEVTDVIRDGPDDADEDVMAEERQPCTTAAEAAAVPATAFAGRLAARQCLDVMPYYACVLSLLYCRRLFCVVLQSLNASGSYHTNVLV